MPTHRRASSVGRYAPVVGEPGDITDSYTSGAMTPSMRRLSGFPGAQTTIHIGRTSADDEYGDDDDVDSQQDDDEFPNGGGKRIRGEKGGFANPSANSPMLPRSRAGAGAGAAWRSVDGTRHRNGGSRNWSLRAKVLTFVLLAGALGGLGYFLVVRNRGTFQEESFEDWWHRFELENYAPEWVHGADSNETTATMTATGSTSARKESPEVVAETDAPQRASSWSKALEAIIDRPTASATYGRWSRPTAAAVGSGKGDFEDYIEGDELSTDEAGTRHDWTVSTSYTDSSSLSSSNLVDLGHFAESVGEEVSRMASNGTLSAYKWHATLYLLALNGGTPHLKSGSRADGGGRIIVVGDIHGTHRSLVSLLHGVSYSTRHDTLLHTGDIVTKSTLDDSLRTLALLRQYSAKGVRGNNDQKVLEWRKWMEAYGPMPLRVQSALSDQEAATEARRPVPGLKADYRPLYGGAPKYAGRNAPTPRAAKVKRSWLSWLTGPSVSDDGDQDTIGIETEPEEPAAGASDEDELVEQVSGTTDGNEQQRQQSVESATGRPSARPDEVGLAATGSPDRSWRSRPTSSSRVSVAEPSTNGGDLSGAEYAYLSSDLTVSEREKLGLVVPAGWEWGSEHFELAKRLSVADVEYLESLPLTLWVEDLKSWIVHAGMVPWASLRKSLARVSSARTSPLSSSKGPKPLPELLESASGLTFSPASSSLTRQLAETSTRTALLLEQANTEPFTLLNMRTLALTGGSSRSYTSDGKLVKGPPSQWSVSSKGRKASKGSQPWWSVWESSMQDCAIKADEDERCDEAGIIYGHWAGQGLQVQDHSIGLDTGCVYGRRLSALVVPLGANASSTSPLGALAAAAGSSSGTSSFAESEPSVASTSSANEVEAEVEQSTGTTAVAAAGAAEGGGRPKSQPNWHGGLNRVKGSSSGDRLGTSSSSSDRPNRDALSSSSSSSALDSEETPTSPEPTTTTMTAITRPWWRPWLRKRAPPQGRPGIAPWESASASATTEREQDDSGSRSLKKMHASSSRTKGRDGDEDEDEVEVDAVAYSSKRLGLDKKKKKTAAAAVEENDNLREQQVILAQAPEVQAWVVSVDCSSELAADQ